jgi:hypothetical protein
MLPAPLGRCERDLFKNMGRRRLRRSSSSTNRIAEGLRLAFLIFPRWALAYRPDHVLPHPLSLELRLGPHEAVDVEAGVAPRENLLTHSALGHQVVEVGVGRMASRNGPSPRMRSRLLIKRQESRFGRQIRTGKRQPELTFDREDGNKGRSSVSICPFQVGELFKQNNEYSKVSGRSYSIESTNPFDTSFNIKKIVVHAMRFNHGSYIITDSVSGKSRDIHSDIVMPSTLFLLRDTFCPTGR